MKTAVKTVRLDAKTAADIDRLRRRQQRTFSSMAGELLSEAAKMRRCPGILFADGPAGRRARVEGTGLEVWELIATFLALDRNEKRLRKTYHWLSERQILAALGYFRAYPEEIRRLVDASREPLDAEELVYRRRAR